MNASIDTTAPPAVHRPAGVLIIEDKRGSAAMMLTIATEGALFVILFFAYFYLARGGWRWLFEEPPKLPLAIIMLAVLLSSSAVLRWGEQQVKARNYGAARVALVTTFLMGIGFLVIQFFEYKDHLKSLTPRTNVYGSIFYAITSITML
jgi:cytochrome c oxidase subunit 3